MKAGGVCTHLPSYPRCFAFVPKKGFLYPSLQYTCRYPFILSRFTRPIHAKRPNSLRRKLLIHPSKLRLDSFSPSPDTYLHNEAGAVDASVELYEDAQRQDASDDGPLFDLGISISNNTATGTQRVSPVLPWNSSMPTLGPVWNLKVASNPRSTLFFIGILVLSSVVVFSVVRSLLRPTKELQFTPMEKDMMRRKIKSRAASARAGSGICMDDFSAGMRPSINRDEVMDAVRLAKPTNRLVEHTTSTADEVCGVDVKVEEIRELARKAREIEHKNQSLVRDPSNCKEQSISQAQGEMELSIEPFSLMNIAKNSEQLPNMPVEEVHFAPYHGPKTDNDGLHGERADVDRCLQPETRVYNGIPDKGGVVKVVPSNIYRTDGRDAPLSLDSSGEKRDKENHGRRNPKIIRTTRDAKVYLAMKQDRHAAVSEAHIVLPEKTEINSQTSNNNVAISTEGIASGRISGSAGSSSEISSFILNDSDGEGFVSMDSECVADTNFDSACLSKGLHHPDVGRSHLDHRGTSHFSSKGTALSSMPGNGMDNYSDEMRPILEKIGDGFRNSYTAARGKASESLNLASDLTQLQISVGNAELEWMEDEKLREIVFQVRDNELAGRDPFYSMQAEDKQAFFKGLERKVEKENKRLLNLHEYLHSNIDNLDYGADGISIYDPIAKIVPRWKEPPVFTNTEFLSKVGEEKIMLVEGKEGKALADAENSIEVKGSLPTYPQASTKVSSSLTVNNWQDTCNKKGSKKGKIVIEGSDGSVRTGKKLGKEFWEHTKKWSRGFLDSYSAETDPEVKSVMQDIGKDLDRWITEKEIQEAAEIRNKFLERNKQYVKKKLQKLKKEVELFGPKAVVNKYREYAEEKEQDYLWWLDLPFVLCIELYSVEDGDHKVGFYSLEMAADLELEPKPCHVIAFEDPGDCKNLCYIIQAQMEILQNGHAFVVPRPSKEAFREAKANGFGVTVIRKGEIKLNVDQTLEEVEEQITEVGSRIYHDKIMKEHAVDTSQLMAGVFGAGSEPRKRIKLNQTTERATKK